MLSVLKPFFQISDVIAALQPQTAALDHAASCPIKATTIRAMHANNRITVMDVLKIFIRQTS